MSNYLASLKAEQEELRMTRLMQDREAEEARRVAEYKYQRDFEGRQPQTVSERERAKDGADDWSPIDEADTFKIKDGKVVTVRSTFGVEPPKHINCRSTPSSSSSGTPSSSSGTVKTNDMVDLLNWARDNVTWCRFAREMVAQANRNKPLSGKQWETLKNIRTKSEASRASRDVSSTSRPTASTPTAVLDLSKVREMFERARSSGLPEPIFYGEGLILKRAKDNSANPGAIYVRSDMGDIYFGKIIGTVFHPAEAATSDTIRALQIIASDPLAVGLRYAKTHHRCSCCGRKITNPKSVALGIGPVCRERWGL